ncbi:hypothetical protein Efla_004187 [Eimeria flavescens]
MAEPPTMSVSPSPKGSNRRFKGAPEVLRGASKDEKTHMKAPSVIRKSTHDGGLTVRARRSSGGTSGSKKDSLQDFKATSTRRFSNKSASRQKGHRGSLGGVFLKETALGRSQDSAVHVSSDPPKRKGPVKDASDPISDRLPSNQSGEGGEVHTEVAAIPPLIEDIIRGETSTSSPPQSADSLVGALQEQNRELVRESMTLRRALLQHITQEELLSLLSGISAGPPSPASVDPQRPEISNDNTRRQHASSREGTRRRRERHIHQPCVKKFFEAMSCCSGVAHTQSVSFEEPPPSDRALGTSKAPSENELGLQHLPEGPPKGAAQQRIFDEDALIAVDFFPLGRFSEDAATQTEPHQRNSVQANVLGEPWIPSRSSSELKPSASKAKAVEAQSAASRPRVSLEIFRPREGPQLPVPNYEVTELLGSPFNMPYTLPLASLLPQSPYANPYLLPLVAFNGDPLWVVSRVRKALRGALSEHPHPQEALAGLWGVWSEYLQQLAALKKTADAALALHKDCMEKSTTDAGVQADPLPEEKPKPPEMLPVVPLLSAPAFPSIQSEVTKAYEASSRVKPQRTDTSWGEKAMAATHKSARESSKKVGAGVERLNGIRGA